MADSSFGAGIVMGLPDADLLSLLDIAEVEAHRRGLVADAPIEPGTEALVPAARIIRQVRSAIHGEPLMDVARLAAALDNVDRDYEQGWTPAHYARAIAAEYTRLALPEPTDVAPTSVGGSDG